MTPCAAGDALVSNRRQAAQTADPPEVKALSAILVDADTGEVLYAKNPDVQRPPASTTKIMTSILLLEHTRPEDVITASGRAVDVEGSCLNLALGERITARDMLIALLLRSANDGCIAVAEHIAGTPEKFAQMMTKRAREIGATRTLFRNPNGLNQPPNLTTARDLATMARFASRFPQFNEAARTRFASIARAPGNKDTLLRNHAKFLWKFRGADGVKTGYTVPAGRCFVGAATWNGWRLISVVLHSPDIVSETARLMKYGFYQFERRRVLERSQVVATVPVRNGTAMTVAATAAADLHAAVPRGDRDELRVIPRLQEIAAPVSAGQQVGTVGIVREGQTLLTAPLIAAVDVPAAPAVASSSGGRPILFAAAILGSAIIGYGTAIAKTARRRGYRLPSVMRGPYRRR